MLTSAGFASGEQSSWHWSRIGVPAVLALAYLILIATIAAYIAYGWLIHNVSPTAAGSCAYINPMVAVAIGAAFGEPFGTRELAAMAAILAGVALVTRAELRRNSAERHPESRNQEVSKTQLAEPATTG